MQLLLVATGVAALLVLVLRFKLPAFLALLIVSAVLGVALGMDGAAVLESIRQGMASTLGFIAVVVGLGAMFGALLEVSGGIQEFARALLLRFGEARAPWALGAVGFMVGIPVFFDVAFIILVPVVYRLATASGRSTLYYATPLLAALAVSHAFIPPTPGPIAVAQLLNADLGWVIGLGIACGIPAAAVAGPLLALRFRNREPSSMLLQTEPASEVIAATVHVGHTIITIALPLLLILGNTASQAWLPPSTLRETLALIGHPFIALLIACAYAYVMFGLRLRIPATRLQEVMTRALEPAGLVVLVTGAGGVFKQVLMDSGAGTALGQTFASFALSPLTLAFLIAAAIRIAQGSATVAMITSAGLVAPLVQQLALDPQQTALVVIGIAAGATVLSHVNDSGFWLVNRLLQQNEAETLRSWTVISTVAGLTGFMCATIASWIL